MKALILLSVLSFNVNAAPNVPDSSIWSTKGLSPFELKVLNGATDKEKIAMQKCLDEIYVNVISDTLCMTSVFGIKKDFNYKSKKGY